MREKKGLLVSSRNVGATLLDTILIVACLVSPVTSYADPRKAEPGKESVICFIQSYISWPT